MKIIKFIVIWLVLVGSSVSCSKNDNINMLPNIDDLYAQPLPVIQKCVQGKWKWYISCGGVAGCQEINNTFVNIKEDHYVVDYEDGSQRTFYFSWKKYTPADNEHETYVMWNEETNKAWWCFVSIKNDTLTAITFDVPFSFGFVRIK